MGMVSSLVRVSEEQLEKFKKDSSLLEDLIYDENNFDQDWYIDLEKSWDGIQYILTGNGVAGFVEPNDIGRAIFSGQILDEEQDLGYGPAHYLERKQVKNTNNALKLLSEDEIICRFNPSEMNQKEVYPQFWDHEETLDYLIESMKDLKEFYSKAAKNKQAVLTWLS